MPVEQSENKQSPEYWIVNADASTSSSSESLIRFQYSYDDTVFREQENGEHSNQIPQNSALSQRDPRLVDNDETTYERRFNNFEGLGTIRYASIDTNEIWELRKKEKKLKKKRPSYFFGVINNVPSNDNFNEHNVGCMSEPWIQKTQIDRKAETYTNCSRQLNTLNTEEYQNVNVVKINDVVDLTKNDVDVVNDNETKRTSNKSEQYHKQRNEPRKSREDNQKSLAEIVKNIIDSLKDDTSNLGCTTRTLSTKNYEMIKTHNLNDQTKNNIIKENKNILSVDNSNFDNKHQDLDNFCGLIETNQNQKSLSERPIELIDLTYDDTADVRTNKNVGRVNIN